MLSPHSKFLVMKLTFWWRHSCFWFLTAKRKTAFQELNFWPFKNDLEKCLNVFGMVRSCVEVNRFLLPDFHSSKKFFCFFAKLLLTHLWTQIPNLNSVSLSHYLPLKEMGIILPTMTAFFIYLSWLNPNLRPPYYPPNQPWISGNLFISLVHPDQSELKTRYMLELTILSHLLQN